METPDVREIDATLAGAGHGYVDWWYRKLGIVPRMTSVDGQMGISLFGLAGIFDELRVI